FGDHGALAGNTSAQSQIEVTYFTTKDPNVFISEEIIYFTTKDPNAFTSENAGLNHSANSAILSNSQFITRLEKMQNEDSANLKKREDAVSSLGGWAEVDLER